MAKIRSKKLMNREQRSEYEGSLKRPGHTRLVAKESNASLCGDIGNEC